MNADRIRAAVAALRAYSGDYLRQGQLAVSRVDGHLIGGDVPAILSRSVPGLRYEWRIIRDRDELGEHQWCDHNVAEWLGIDAATADRIIEAPTKDDAIERLMELIECPACGEPVDGHPMCVGCGDSICFCACDWDDREASIEDDWRVDR